LIRRWLALLFGPAVRADGDEARSQAERLPIPFTFPPRLRFAEAVISAIGAFLRLFLGSLLFAVWGACSLAVRGAARGLFLRAALLLALFAGFLAAMVLMLLGVRLLMRLVWPRQS
jgi:hypothetical protein